MRTHNNWIHLSNPFFHPLKSSYKKTDVVVVDTLSKFNKERSDSSFIDSLYQRLKPFGEVFKEKLIDWQLANQHYAGATLRVGNLSDELRGSLIRKWDILIQVVYDINSPEYLELLPNNRTPFQTGSREARINSVGNLAKNLLNYPDLADLQVQVQTFYDGIVKVRDRQQGLERKVRFCSDDLKAAQQNVIDELHYVFLSLKLQHYKNTAVVTGYFQMDMLRDTASSSNDDDEVLASLPALDPETNEVIEVGNGGDSEGE